jgi:chloramphenicol-sensitive protein RarD
MVTAQRYVRLSNHGRGILANVLWGMVPIYYYFVRTIDPVNMLVYRSLFTFLVLFMVGVMQRKLLTVEKLRQAVVPALLLVVNGYVYILGILNGQVIEAAYGYLITPILIILCGRVMLAEKLALPQWFGVCLCLVSIIYYAVAIGALPWYGLGIALPFAFYSTLHKKAGTADAFDALRHETMIIVAIAGVFLACFWNDVRESVLADLGGATGPIIALSGLVTVLPLVLFLGVCPKLSTLHLGIYQFISPIIAAIVAVTLFHDTLSQPKLIVGTGLLIGMALAVLPPCIFVRASGKLCRLMDTVRKKAA